MSERSSAALAEKSSNVLVHSSNVFVEIDSLREQQVTENTLIFLQLLVKGSHDDASELETSPNSRTARKQNLLNRPNVGDCLVEWTLRRILGVAARAAYEQIRDDVVATMKLCNVCHSNHT